MTLHQRIEIFKKKDRFRYKLYHIGDIGRRALDLFKVLYPEQHLAKVESIEEHGTFMVLDYPDHFLPILDQLIRNKKHEVIEASGLIKIKRGLLDPPAFFELQLIKPEPVRKRKRIPAKVNH